MANLNIIKALSQRPVKSVDELKELAESVPSLLDVINKLQLELWSVRRERDRYMMGLGAR